MIQMSIESDAASQVVSIYTKGIEETAHVAVKLGGEVFEVSKQLITILLVKGVWENLIRQEGKLSGKVSLQNLLRKSAEKGQPIHILEIKDKEEFAKVSKELANSGVLFAKAKGDSYNIVFTEDSAALVNRTIENLKLTSIGNDISSDVTSGKVSLDKESISLDDDDLQIADSFEDFERSKPKVDLHKDNDNGKVIESDDIHVTKTFEDYTADQVIDMDGIEELDDPFKLAEDISKESGGSDQLPLTRDGEAAPSKQRSAAAKSSDKAKPSIHEKVAAKKAERAAEAKQSIGKTADSIGKAADKIKEIGEK